MRRLPLAALALGALAACTRAPGARPAAGPAPSPDSALQPSGTPALPPVPLVLGPLAPKVVYPPAGSLVQSRDSNFILGSVGNGHATLTINGAPVRVWPNGSFIAWLPVPPSDSARYDLVAAFGADTARLTHPVRVPAPVRDLPPSGPLVIDSASVEPAGALALRDSERVRVGVRAPTNATVVWVGQGGAQRPLVNGAAAPGAYAYDSAAPGPVPARFLGSAEQWAIDVPAAELRQRTELVISRDADTVRWPLPAIAPSPARGSWAMLGADSAAMGDTDRVVIARPTPAGTYKWLLLPGTIVEVTGRAGTFTRVRLDRELEAWVNGGEVRELPPGWPAPRRVAGSARLIPAREWVDLAIPIAARPAFLVEEGTREIVLTLYDTRSNLDLLQYVANDTLIEDVRWSQPTSDRTVVTLRLRTAPYGYLAFWDGGRFVLRVRRPPRIDRDAPLRGLTIAVDPGHPPIGATGPTGLYEADAVLAVGLQLRQMLEARGAHVFMTRTAPGPVGLYDRPVMARRANANALVSIHLNALPDGQNPFVRALGSGAYYFHPQSVPLARALERGMVARMGLANYGIFYDNLALARPTWMPAVLCEGAFIIMPEQEAALRTPEFQARYARGIADGLEAYFREMGSAR